MAKYKYLITDKYGKEKKGTMEAVSEEAAMRKLKGEGSIVLELSEAFDLDNASWNITIGNPVKKKDITIFCKQFYSILTAGVTVIAGCLLGAVIQGGIQLYHKKSGRFPTTPYLAMGVYLVLLWGDTVLNWYVRTFVY